MDLCIGSQPLHFMPYPRRHYESTIFVELKDCEIADNVKVGIIAKDICFLQLEGKCVCT